VVPLDSVVPPFVVSLILVNWMMSGNRCGLIFSDYLIDWAEYFEGIDGVTPMPKRMNPATWMVDVVSSRARKPSETPQTTPASTPLTTDLAVLYSSSAFAESNLDEIDQAILVRF
jgi:hypothetical protein